MYLHKPGQTGKPGPFCPGFSLFASDRAIVQVLALTASVLFESSETRHLPPLVTATDYITNAMLSNSR
jgi:hypothetical protein